MGQLMKCDAVYAKPFWRADGLNGFGINDSGAARAVFDNCPKDGDPGVLLAFVGGSTWRKYGRLPLAQRRKAVLEGFAALFGEQALHPIDYIEQDWTKERWTTGGPTAIHAPGSLVKYGSAIRQPFGRVHWAGTETATYWSGYMDGAVRSGERAGVRGRGEASLKRLVAPGRAAARLDPADPGPGGGSGEVDDHGLRADAGAGLPGVRLRAPQRPGLRRQLRQPAPGSGRRSSSGPATASCRRSWTVPGQVLGHNGVQVANQTRKGKLVLLETSTASVLVLDIDTGKFTRVARLPDGAVPNYATWVPGRQPAGHRLRAGRDLEGTPRRHRLEVVRLAGPAGHRVRHHRHRLPQAVSTTC